MKKIVLAMVTTICALACVMLFLPKPSQAEAEPRLSQVESSFTPEEDCTDAHQNSSKACVTEFAACLAFCDEMPPGQQENCRAWCSEEADTCIHTAFCTWLNCMCEAFGGTYCDRLEFFDWVPV